MLFAYFAPRVKAYLLGCGASASDADDLAQETMLALWRKAPYFDPAKGNPSTWVFTIARSLRITALRHEKGPDVLQQLAEDVPAKAPGADNRFAVAEQERRIADALKALPSDQAEVVRLAFFEENSHAQIERRLGIPLGTIKSRIRRAMPRLRAALDEDQ
ncbi:MAG: sigma-70 family RNA polymerase sigma factor [Pseudomonadota bacterium]|nr:sigma-70 family RNA polymerase sigma factor [Pseudomonadota bacterium]